MNNTSEFIKVSYFSIVKIAQTNIIKGLTLAAKKYSKGNLVDLGCGTKPYENIFKPYVQTYFGVDFHTTADAHYASDTKADLYIDCTDTKMEQGSFDTLLSTQVMEHIYDTRKYVSECFRLLRKDGIAIFTVPLLWQCHGEPYDYYRFTKYSLRMVFEQQGFEIFEIRELEGAYAALIQTKIISLYSFPSNNIPIKMLQMLIRVFWIPFLNFSALHFDKLFYNNKLCINYLVVVKKK